MWNINWIKERNPCFLTERKATEQVPQLHVLSGLSSGHLYWPVNVSTPQNRRITYSSSCLIDREWQRELEVGNAEWQGRDGSPVHVVTYSAEYTGARSDAGFIAAEGKSESEWKFLGDLASLALLFSTTNELKPLQKYFREEKKKKKNKSSQNAECKGCYLETEEISSKRLAVS